jgi:hypothetical protein
MTHTHDHEAHHGHGGAHGHEGDADDPSMEINTERLETVNDMAVLEDLYAAASDAEERSLVVSRALEVDARSGARMALKFLEDDHPMLFGLMVVEKLEEIAGRDMGYDIDKPYDSPSNRESIAEMKKALGLD